MDHETAVREKMTERYLLKELNPEERDTFEEHFFDCQECAYDLRIGAAFISQSKGILRTGAEQVLKDTVPERSARRSGWNWFRPMFAIPLLIVFLVVICYQNLIVLPKMRSAAMQPKVLPWATVTAGTWGSEKPVITASSGNGFMLFLRIPANEAFTRYTADIYSPAGRLDFSLAIPAVAGQDEWPVVVPAGVREAGIYRIAMHGTTAAGESKDLGSTAFELQTQELQTQQ
jgi:hypothetical protein